MNEVLLDTKLRRLRAADKLTGERATFAPGTDPAKVEETALNHVRRDPWGGGAVDFAPADPDMVERIRAATRRPDVRALPAVVAELRARMSDGSDVLMIDAAELRLLLEAVS